MTFKIIQDVYVTERKLMMCDFFLQIYSVKQSCFNRKNLLSHSQFFKPKFNKDIMY